MTNTPASVWNRFAPWTVIIALVAGVPGLARADRPTAPRLLPDTTAAMLWIRDAPELSESFMNTAMGRMSQDPQVKPIFQHLYGSLANLVDGVKEQIGLSLPELLAIPQGELMVALVAPDEEPPQFVLLIDVGDHLSNARKLLERANEALERSGAKKTVQTVAGTKLIVYDGLGQRGRQLILVEKDSTVLVGSNADVLKSMLEAWTGKEVKTLSENKKFAAIMRRSGSEELKPHIVWYADPIDLMRSIGQDNVGVRMAVAMLPTLGLDGVKALGGSITFDAGQLETVAYSHILLDSYRTGILEIVALGSGETDPERWVPGDVASYNTLHWDFQKSFKTLTSVYDGFRGEGALARALKRRFEDNLGVDFEEEVLPNLAGRVTHFVRIELPVTRRSQSNTVGFQVSDPAALEKVLDKVFQKIEHFLTRRSHLGRTYFEITPPRLSEAPNGEGRPRPCFGLIDDYLVITDRPTALKRVIATAEGTSETLADALDFKLVASKIRRRGHTKPAMLSFERPQEGMRFLYELALSNDVQQQLRRQAEKSPFFKSLNNALDQNPLPPFSVIEKYFAPTGAVLVDDVDGLHYSGFSLRRDPE